MTMTPLFAKLHDVWRRFRDAKDGNTVVVFALSFIPLVGLTGAAVDYSRANSIQTAMQAVADTTALMVAQSAASQTPTDLQTSAVNYYKGMFTRTDAKNLQVTATYSSTGGPTVYIRATATYPTSFMGVMGFRQLPLAATSTANWGNSRLRVALVLDNTGSMASSNKMTALKTATNNLLTQLHGAAVNAADVYVSIIPFVKDVNLDSSNNSQNWIYWDDAAHTDNNSWDAQNGSCSSGNYSNRASCVASSGGTCSISGYTSQSSCTSAGTCSISGHSTQSGCQAAASCSLTAYTSQSTCQAATGCTNSNDTTQSSCVADGYCVGSNHHHQSTCVSNGGTWVTPAIWGRGVWSNGVWTAGVWSPPTWTPAAHSTWNGCVADRGDPTGPNTNNYDTNASPPTPGTAASLLPAEQYSACPAAVMGLNNNWTSMTSLVNNMVSNGSTNQNIGLALGWMSLVGGGPFSVPPLDANYSYQQVIILLTDGLNTQDRWYGNGMDTATQVDDRQALTCTNIKAANITLYTIQVNTDGSPTSQLLKNCATDSSKFFLLTSSNQIVTTFNTIGTNLSRLRIAK